MLDFPTFIRGNIYATTDLLSLVIFCQDKVSVSSLFFSILPQSIVKNGKQAMVLFSLSVTGMNQSVMISNRQGRAQRSSSEIPGEVASEEAEPRRRRSKQAEEPKEEKKCCSKCVCKPIDADTIDIYARAVFPFTFAVVNVIYWVAYTM